MQLPIIAFAALMLTACESYSPPRYAVPQENTPVLKTMSAARIRVSAFTLATPFEGSCRGTINIDPPVGMSYQQYFQNALADELRAAGIYEEARPTVVLSGTIEKLAFSSTVGVTNGEWNISVRITSSNGKSASFSEFFSFESTFAGRSACRRIAEAFQPAVQNLIGKAVRSTQFRSLIGI